MSAACGVDRTSLRRSVFECFGLHRNTFFRFGPQCKLFGMRMVVTAEKRAATFYGWRVVQAAFVLAIFGWGLGFYGPPVFLSLHPRVARLVGCPDLRGRESSFPRRFY